MNAVAANNGDLHSDTLLNGNRSMPLWRHELDILATALMNGTALGLANVD